MPGAQLVEVVGESIWKARLDVKLGPVALAFDTDVTRESVDESQRRVTLAARARERRGRGVAQATVASSLTTIDGATRVDIVTDLKLSGPVAQYGRGMVQDISSGLISRFAECLEAQLVATPAEASDALVATSKPVGGLALGVRALGHAIMRFMRRLVGRGQDSDPRESRSLRDD